MADEFKVSEEKMRDASMGDVAIAQFKRMYDIWRAGGEETTIIEDDVEPLVHVPSFHDVYETINHDKAVEAFSRTAFLKLNGGLGTSMGLEQAKSLLPVRRHKARQMRFLDIILGQVVMARRRLDVPLPLTLMNSFRTSRDTMRRISRNRYFVQDTIPCEIIQHREPRIVEDTGLPVSYEKDRQLEWCPPGHGDLFATIWESGLLDILQKQGMSYLFISNSDNLGARPSRTL
ncbi:UTP--glucose-1-phosphate uridylyltransferase, partial [uncultured Bifidobacterium sp.]|uniref:UTP--glucose-1-phosphate uridylyltransferase n=1 Tax=uncultured Bifidobacterium sp. TaxID=165187 RepID=UPI00260176A4